MAVGIGAIGGGLAVYLFMNAFLSQSNTANAQLTAATSTGGGGTTTTTNTTGVSTPVTPGSAAGS